MGRATAHFFAPPPGALGRGQISLNIIKFQLHSKFQRLSVNQTLCVFSHTKNIKPIRRDFHLATWVMPQGWDLGVPWGGVGGHFSEIHSDLVCELLTRMAHAPAPFFIPPPTLVPWGGAKRSNIIKSELQSQFQRCLNQTHKWKIYNISDGIFIRPPGSYPGVGFGGTLGIGGSIFFL